MGNFYSDNDDLKFYVEKGIDWEPLVRLVEDDFRQPDGFENLEGAKAFYRDVLEMVGRFFADEVDPKVDAIERAGLELVDGEVQHPEEFDEIFEKLKSLQLYGMSVPREVGGMNTPVLLYFLTTEMFSRADVSLAAHYGFHGGIAAALLVYSIEEGTTEVDEETGRIVSTRFQDEIAEIIAGDAWGSMDITEPDAGSDMGALRTKAEQDGDGNWYVTGQKIFITSGHGKYHIVIARTEEDDGEGPMSGLSGLSTFLVPAYRDDEDGNRERLATVNRIEEKLGHHASPTCSVIFEKTPAYLIGERGEGFKHMLLLMNNARIGVGFESIGVSEAALRMARAYAEERRAFGKPIDRHEMIADYLDEMETDILGMRALAVDAGYHEELGYRTKLARERRPGEYTLADRRRQKRAKKRARRLTPLLKFIAAEKAVEHARRAVQIHGGVGYTTEYGAEKLLRDAMVMPIYEGTTQIQALMAMKDTLGGVMKAPQDFIKRLAQTRWRTVSERDERRRSLAGIQLASLQAQQHLIQKTAIDKFKNVRQRPLTEWINALTSDWNPKKDFSFAMLHAEHLAQILVDEAIAEILYEQGREFPDRMDIFDRYVERAAPRARHLLDKITSTGDRLLSELHPEQKPADVAE